MNWHRWKRSSWPGVLGKRALLVAQTLGEHRYMTGWEPEGKPDDGPPMPPHPPRFEWLYCDDTIQIREYGNLYPQIEVCACYPNAQFPVLVWGYHYVQTVTRFNYGADWIDHLNALWRGVVRERWQEKRERFEDFRRGE